MFELTDQAFARVQPLLPPHPALAPSDDRASPDSHDPKPPPPWSRSGLGVPSQARAHPRS
jgi:hypothetical protein